MSYLITRNDGQEILRVYEGEFRDHIEMAVNTWKLKGKYDIIDHGFYLELNNNNGDKIELWEE